MLDELVGHVNLRNSNAWDLEKFREWYLANVLGTAAASGTNRTPSVLGLQKKRRVFKKAKK